MTPTRGHKSATGHSLQRGSASGADGAPVGNEQVGPGDARRLRDDGEEITLDADWVAVVGQAEAATEPHAVRIHDNAGGQTEAVSEHDEGRFTADTGERGQRR